MQMEYSKKWVGNFAVLSILFVGVLYLCIWSSSLSNPLLHYQKSSNCHLPSSQVEIFKFPVDDLQLALERASMPNKTVIIAVVNQAYVEQSVKAETSMLDVFLEGFWLGEDTRPLLNHLLLVAVDQTAYDRCMFKRLHCYKMETHGVDFGGEKLYMSQDFVEMMWRRTLLLLDVLKHGYNFIFTMAAGMDPRVPMSSMSQKLGNPTSPWNHPGTWGFIILVVFSDFNRYDTDVVWLRNPFPRLSKNESIDIQISTDGFNGDPQSEANYINTGFYYIKSNNKTISLFDAWYGRKDNSTGKKEQDVLFELIQEGAFRQLNLNPRFLDTLYFSGFCTDSTDIRAVTTVHANCCRSIIAKVTDLTAVLRDWKMFKLSSVGNETVPFKWSGHFGCWNSWTNTSVP